MLEAMHMRRHNARAMQLMLHKFKIQGTAADFIDREMEKMLKDIEKSHRKEQAKSLKAQVDKLKEAP